MHRGIGCCCWLAASALAGPGAAAAANQAKADLVVTDARIYTADPGHSMATALAVTGGKLVYVGDNAGARALIGKKTRIEALGGRLVLPGLVDSHIHPTDIPQWDVCDLHNRPYSFKALSVFIRGCIQRYQPAPGRWVSVRQWNYSEGNDVDAAHPNLRATLDAASTEHPVHLLGDRKSVV